MQENIDLDQDLEGGNTVIPEAQDKILQDVKVLGERLAGSTITDKQDFVSDKIDSMQDLEQDKIKNPVSSCGYILQDSRQAPDLDKDLSKTRSSRQDLSEARSCKTSDQIMSQDFVASWKQDLARYLGFLIRCIFLISCTVALGWFVMLQTLPLYKSLSFDLPDQSAIGALVLAIGFTSLHAACPRGRTRIYCFGVCLYEIGLVGAGTFAYEQDLVAQKILQDSKGKILQESLVAASMSYDKVKKRYSNPKDKMYQNGWYFNNHVSPALNKLEEIQHKLDNYRSSFDTPLQKSAGYLKLLYRVLLVILLMTLTHHTITAVLNCFSWKASHP